MSRLARWCARRRLTVVGAWLLLLVVLGGIAGAMGANFTNATTMPDSESGTAYSLLDQLTGADSEATKTGTIVWQSTDAAVDSAAVRGGIEPMLDAIAGMKGVTVASPYTDGGAAQIDTSRNVAYADVTLAPSADVEAVKAVASSKDGAVDVQLGGRAFTAQPGASGLTEVIGIIGALAVLLLMFRSLWAAFLPIITGVVGVVTSLLMVVIASHYVDLADSTPTMGALIGLAVGIDYALFIVNRHRKSLLSGLPVHASIVRALDTSGRAVVFAGATVVVALVGVFVVQIDILTGMARAAALTVVLTVLTALTLLPAMLSLLGDRVLSKRQRRDLSTTAPGRPVETAGNAPGRIASAWAALVERHRRLTAGVALLVIVAMAVPALTLRLGSSDASSDPSSSDTHAFYETMSTSFGDGYDADLLLVAKTPDAASQAAFAGLVDTARTVDDVAAVSSTPSATGQEISAATVTPRSSAQTEETADLVDRLRSDTIPAAERGTDLQVYVGGVTAGTVDNATATTSKLPLYLVLIATLGFVLLAIAFRSVLVPLIGAVGNLLTLAVALGAVALVFQRDWTAELLGVGSAAPIESIVPVLVIGIMFGLAMDYQVFLVSRMHEEWGHTRDNARSVRVGMRETGRVVAAAAVIMLCVFASFGFSGQRIIAEIGIGLAVGVLVDAFLLRMTVIPALMHLAGPRNWAYPRWADRITPRLSVEGAPDPAAGEPVVIPHPR